MSILWVDKYKPQKLEELSGQNKAATQIANWITTWKQGRSLLICGPTGTGKSLIPEIIAKEKNFQFIHLNANEVSTEFVEEITNSSKSKSFFHKGKLILVDEVEGFSGRDRGIMSSVLELVKQSKYPVILISGDPYLPKLASVKEYCEIVKFDKIAVPSITKKMKDICKKEGVDADEEVLKNIAKFSGGDIRSAITDLQVVCMAKKKLTQEDLESIGFREREQNIFNILQPIFHSRSVGAGRKALLQSEKDSDEVFWWIENNLTTELKTSEEIVYGYDLLSHADILRNKVMKQQNWRFKGLAADLMSSISVYKTSHTGFVMYRPPQRLMQLGRTKGSRETLRSICEKIGKKIHCSKREVKNIHLPYFKLILKNNP
ncbi:MAG: replication factor C large subunit, partial [Candidatus Aenigmarchaeota archaeon]|nr:replication factor C large subunit [Candidatus Aenigmarchaeota archaeon]